MNSTLIYSACALICAALLAYTLTPLVRVLAIKIKAIDVPTDGRRMHHKPIPRIGGLAIFLAFLITSIGFCRLDRELVTILIGGSALVLLGILDDVYRLNAFLKLAVQIVAALFAVSQGVTIDYICFFGKYVAFGNWAIPITVFWIVGLTNAVNFIDGLDGLACGVSAISSISLCLTMLLSDSSVAHCLITALIAAACLGFLPFNANPARIFMGDTGALFLGYALSVLSVVGVFKSDMVLAFFIPLSIFGLPLADTFFAVVRRLAHGKSPFAPDRGHLHHRLIDMGFGQKQSVRILYAVCAILGISAVMLTGQSTRGGALMLVVGLAIFFVTFLILRNPKLRIHSGIYNEDEGVAPPVETFEDVIGEIPSITPEEAAPEAAAEEKELSNAAKSAPAETGNVPTREEDESKTGSDGRQ